MSIHEKTKQSESDVEGSIAIATFTRYPNWHLGNNVDITNIDKVRGDLALKTVQTAIKNYRIFIDSSPESEANFIKSLNNTRAVLYDRGEASRTEGQLNLITSLLQDKSIQAILITEPEKIDLINYVPEIMAPILEGHADMVLPCRNQYLYEQTYPKYMFESEMFANRILNSVLKKRGIISADMNYDFFFGPLAWKNSPEIVKEFTKQYRVQDTLFTRAGIGKKYIGNDPAIMAVATALLSNKLRLVTVEVPYRYNYDQWRNEVTEKAKLEEFLDRRRDQRIKILTQYILMLTGHYESVIS